MKTDGMVGLEVIDRYAKSDLVAKLKNKFSDCHELPCLR